MNYIEQIAWRIDYELGFGQDPDLMLLYALLALTRGVNTTLENVHDAWSAWRTKTKPDHKSLVPFDMLTPEVQELDRKYMEAIHRTAYRLWGGIFYT